MQKAETIRDLLNGPIQITSIKIERADILLQVLQENYLEWNAPAVQNDKLKSVQFISSYEEIQALISAIRDDTHEARILIDSIE
ncbi:MAG: hypothetical protein BGN88_06440 [Clostridiales bacterium 43-6]|nr:MAG: hypothetical protein BGN88_06440 [Clostridiales bacterium 43-6]